MNPRYTNRPAVGSKLTRSRNRTGNANPRGSAASFTENSMSPSSMTRRLNDWPQVGTETRETAQHWPRAFYVTRIFCVRKSLQAKSKKIVIQQFRSAPTLADLGWLPSMGRDSWPAALRARYSRHIRTQQRPARPLLFRTLSHSR